MRRYERPALLRPSHRRRTVRRHRAAVVAGPGAGQSPRRVRAAGQGRAGAASGHAHRARPARAGGGAARPAGASRTSSRRTPRTCSSRRATSWRRTGCGSSRCGAATARDELAEVLGPDYVTRDRFARLLAFRGNWDEEFKKYHPEGRVIFESFARGVNAAIQKAHRREQDPGRVPDHGLPAAAAVDGAGRCSRACPAGRCRATRRAKCSARST